MYHDNKITKTIPVQWKGAVSNVIHSAITDIFEFILPLIKMPCYLATHIERLCMVLEVTVCRNFLDMS